MAFLIILVRIFCRIVRVQDRSNKNITVLQNYFPVNLHDWMTDNQTAFLKGIGIEVETKYGDSLEIGLSRAALEVSANMRLLFGGLYAWIGIHNLSRPGHCAWLRPNRYEGADNGGGERLHAMTSSLLSVRCSFAISGRRPLETGLRGNLGSEPVAQTLPRASFVAKTARRCAGEDGRVRVSGSLVALD
jgi:hypothetical protein